MPGWLEIVGTRAPNAARITAASPAPAAGSGQQPFKKGRRYNGHLILETHSFADGNLYGNAGSRSAMQGLMNQLGYGELYKNGFTVPDGSSAESNNPRMLPSPELQKVLDKVNAQYGAARISRGGDKRQFVFYDKKTGQPIMESAVVKRNVPWKDVVEGVLFVGGVAVGAASIGGTLGAAGAGGGGASAATNAALAESAVGTAGYGASSAGLGGATAAGGGAAAVGDLAYSGQMAAYTPASTASLPAVGSNPAWMTQAAQAGGAAGGASGLGGVPSAGGTTAPGYSASANYGSGLSGAQTSAYDSVIGATGSPGLADAASQTVGAGQGVSQTVIDNWNRLTPAQQARLGGSLASAIAGGFAGASSGGSSGGTSAATTAADRNMQIGLSQQQLADQLRAQIPGRQADYDAQFDQILGEMLTSQRNNNAFSNDLMAQYRTTYMPAQQRMADTAANYDTAGRREAAGAEAVAGVDAQFQRQREGLQRDLGRAGVSMDSGRALTLDQASRFGAAKAAAGADRVARQGVEDRGIALTQGVVSQGNQVAQTGLAAGSLSNSAGSQAGNTLQGQQATYNATVQPTLAAYQGAASATGNAGSLYDQATRTRMGLDSQRNADRAADAAGWGSLIGTLGSLYYSDKKTKHVGKKVSGKKALRSLEDADVHEYRYKKEFGGGKHIGRMAGKADPKGPDGLRKISVQDEIGKQHAAIAELSKQVKKLSLADAKRKAA